MTPVIFRKDKCDGRTEITAVFPTIDEGNYQVACYAHVGQHSGCTREWYNTTKAAKPAEYASLLRELQQIGYDDLKVYKRWSRHFAAPNTPPARFPDTMGPDGVPGGDTHT